ncbi:MAG: threonine--tRNA ligase [Bacilli bacterium]
MINIKEDEKLSILNHSCAHLLAHAVKRIYPEALFWVGPVIEDGFYYDIDLGDKVVTEEDLEKIEREMKRISKDNKKIIKLELSKEEALEMFKDDPYKIDLINNMEDSITAYKQDDFIDLCRGPHVEYTKDIKYFKLLKVSGAYYKGDSKNKMLQRIYGICFNSEEELNDYLNMLEEAKKRDHRILGKELDLFMLVPEAGQGLAFWLPRGMAVRKVLEDYQYKEQLKAGYQFVSTPVIASKWLYETSGHWEHYQDMMFPLMERDGEELVLRPMSCPHHMLIFKSKLRSYRDLPIRYSEIVLQHRYESSGGLSGLERVRAMNLTDAHIFARKDQIEEEVIAAYELIDKAIKDLGLEIDYIELALRGEDNNSDKYHSNDEVWIETEEILKNILDKNNIEYIEKKGEAAFYGPKIDIQVRNILGTVITMSTIQLDMVLPERFDLTYVDNDGNKKRPVAIHRGYISTYERLLSILIEQYAGAFPLWLAPVQVNIIPVNSEYHSDYSKEIKELLIDNDIRIEFDDRNEKLGYKIRESQMQKIPYSVVIGDKEKEEGTITYRKYNSNDMITVNKEEFISLLKEEIIKKTI